MEFKVGDTVKILDRVGEEINYSPIYTNNMLKYAGTLTSIKEITGYGSLKLDNNDCYWDKKAVKLVNEDKEVHPSRLKEGDYIKLYSENTKISFLYIVKEVKGNNIYRHAGYDIDSNLLYIDAVSHWSLSDSTKITYATPEEKKRLNDILLKRGYIWNNEAKQLQNVDTITINNSTGIIDIPKEYCISDCISRVNPTHIPSHPKYGVFVDTDKKELNLFPTKKHYQLNFNY